ncbi:Sorbitol dehydrogenase [Corynebacterium capitovis DSM 44611]|uniref:zinc-binding dehydrogenase n=1 Tax=Corynebacterium capitovis TaxID=131081 RepID=UPI00037A4FAC|nr:zinc-binding dehydrogenase [Corynebacterium capitovis]WKD57008.1 Sorbitol dehydrogenase [Corynebacterium capitovis DSM 44611]
MHDAEKTMMAARMHIGDEGRELKIDQVPIPEPGNGEVLVKVMAAGVCLSDVHLLDGSLTAPHLDDDVVTLGHETAGVVEKLGEGVSSFAPGDRVVMRSGYRDDKGDVYGHGIDFDGGWAEYVLTKESTLISLPESISFEVGAIIPDAVSTPWSAIDYTAQVKEGQTIGVWGVGGLGAHAVKLLVAEKASPIIAMDPSDKARERALEYGADYALDSTADDFEDKLREITGGKMLDVAFDFAGVPPVRKQALSVLGVGGKLVLVGISGGEVVIPSDMDFQMNRNAILGHYGSLPNSIPDVVQLLAEGRVNFDASVTEVLPLSEAATAVDHLKNKVGDPIRIVLRPGE